MAWCERALADHVDCCKVFLRHAREEGHVYAPGTYGDHDRCSGTRLAYFECVNDPGRKGSDKFAGQERHQSLACESLLIMHGKCVERYLKASTHAAIKAKQPKNINYFFLSHAGQDKCVSSRTEFEKCIRQHRQIGAGEVQDPTKGLASSSTSSRNVIQRSISRIEE
eukprot:NODE_21444_length_752_cov_12.324800.p1 GENE.NODE_21444_length_752_cov_12.324800~~NODE_21444_length_752_cov_12.324800.p1  ORF type:complete len:167 (-),score=35.72 NODE_21444_length_752_cov_12.324800:165-665(-)